jgi:hypothetical protein
MAADRDRDELGVRRLMSDWEKLARVRGFQVADPGASGVTRPKEPRKSAGARRGVVLLNDGPPGIPEQGLQAGLAQ